jgi:hypothetical protein
MGESPSYESAVTAMRRPIAAAGTSHSGRLRDLVRQATLAASSHNTQPWKFTLAERSITILRTSHAELRSSIPTTTTCSSAWVARRRIWSTPRWHADVRIHDDSIEELTPDQFEGQLSVSLSGPMNVTRAVFPVMRKQRAVTSSRSPRRRVTQLASTS